jgi:hypothetical protein
VSSSGDDARKAGDEAGRQVDLAEQQREHLRQGEDHEDRALHEQVHDVAGGQELRVQRLEDDGDDDHADEHREDAALAGPQPGEPDVHVVAERAGGDLGRDGDLRSRVGQSLLVRPRGLVVQVPDVFGESFHRQFLGGRGGRGESGGASTRPKVM